MKLSINGEALDANADACLTTLKIHIYIYHIILMIYDGHIFMDIYGYLYFSFIGFHF